MKMVSEGGGARGKVGYVSRFGIYLAVESMCECFISIRPRFAEKITFVTLSKCFHCINNEKVRELERNFLN